MGSLVAILLLVSCSVIQKTHEIPERREFPLNKNISPCDDYYGHVCSKVNSSFELRDDRTAHTFSFNDSYERLLEKKKDYLNNLLSIHPKSHRAKSLQNVYRACMDEKNSILEEREIVANTLKELNKIKTREEFQIFIAKNIEKPNYSFIDFGKIPNQSNSMINDVYLLGDLMSLPENSYYDKEEVVENFHNVLTQFFSTLNLSVPKQRASGVIRLEKKFVKTYPLPKDFRVLINIKSRTTKKKLKKFRNLHLKYFLKNISNKTLIRDLTPKNFETIDDLLANASLLDLKSLYLYNELKNKMDDAYSKFYKIRFDFNHKYLGGPKKRPSRKERCTRYVMKKFKKEIDAELISVLFPNFPEEKFVQLVHKVRQQIIKGIRNNEWLSRRGKKNAVKKVSKMRLQLVKPRNHNEWDFNPVANYLPDRRYLNKEILEKNLIAKAFRELKSKRDRDRWYMGPLTVNAYYTVSDNKFVMPMGILQYPFYDPMLSEHINLAAVGAVVGHEIGHGIDDKGALYDYKGRLHQWMTKKDLMNFKKRGQSFVEQFNKIGHDGNLTLGENIGDHVGLSFAFNAAFENGGTDKQKKEFFASYGRLWCNVMRPQMVKRRLKTDSHSLGKERVNQQVIHIPGFYSAYQCKAGDKMYLPPEKRVRIW